MIKRGRGRGEKRCKERKKDDNCIVCETKMLSMELNQKYSNNTFLANFLNDSKH